MTTEQFDHNAYLAFLEAQLAGIEAERARVEQKQSLLQETIGKVKQLAALSNGNIAPDQLDGADRDIITVPKDTFKGMTHIVEGAIKLLRIVRKPLRNKVLVDALIAGGFPTKSVEPYITFRSVLTRTMKTKHTLTYVNKEWGLPEWNQPQTDNNHETAGEVLSRIAQEAAEESAKGY